MSNNFDKFAILESFLDEVTSYLPEIETNLDRLQQYPGDLDTVEETYRRMHTIAGSAAMMEFPGLARVAQGMEDILGDAIDNGRSLDAPSIGLLRRSSSRLGRLVEHIRAGTDPAAVVAEDNADRAGARGSSTAAPSSQPQYPQYPGSQPFGGPAGLPFPQPPTSATSPSLQVPDWLAAFANPNEGTPPGPPAPTQPQAPSFSFGAPGQGGADTSFGSPPPPPQYGFPPATADQWASSVSNLPTGYTPAMPQQPYAPGYAASTPGGLPGNYAASTGAGGSAAKNESFDDILQAFQAGSSESYGASAPPSVPTQPIHGSGFDASSFGTGAAPSAYHNNGAHAPYAPNGPSQASPLAPTPQAPSRMPGAPVSGGLPDTQVAQQRSTLLNEALNDEEVVRRQVSTLRDLAAQLREASQAMEDERGELRGFLDGSRDALERLEEWAGQQMGLDLRNSPDAVRRYLPLSVIWVTTTRLKKLVALLNHSGRSLTATQEQITETLSDLRSAVSQLGGSEGGSFGVAGSTPGGGFSATVAHFAWAPPASASTPSTPTVDGSLAHDASALPAGTRAEIERNVREQLRRELEDEVRAEVANEVRRDEEDRLRQELQIQVRRQLLSELTPSLGSSALTSLGTGAQSDLRLPFTPAQAAKPVKVTSEQSPEALEVFREEAQEHLQTITTGIAQLEAAPGNIAALQSVRRAMHTLKGAAGMMGFTTIQHIAHTSEDLLDRLVEGGVSLTAETSSLLLDTSEALDQLVTGSVDDPQQIQRDLAARYAQIAGIQPPFDATDAPSSGPLGAAVSIAASEEAEEAVGPAAAPDAADLSVRLPLSKLDDLVNLFGELLINRSILEERIDRLNRIVSDSVVVGERLRDVGSQLETRFEAATLPSGRSNGASATSTGRDQNAASKPGGRSLPFFGGVRKDLPTHASEFDELELDRYTEFHRLSRGLSEGVTDIVTLSHEMEALIRESQTSFARENRLSSDFQDRLLKARLVPLQSLVPRLYRTARASAFKEGKEIEFFADGVSTEVDRKVVEEVAGPLLHLVRNAVNHGIERPDVRDAAGKDRIGHITVSAAYEGNQVVISVRDDGRGIDPESIRATAVARGWLDPYAQLSEKEAVNLIFQPGVSTAESLTEESGRGVGLDVVRDAVTRLRGTVEVETVPGQGSVFTMKFPISLQIARAVLVKAGPQTLAIPMAVVEQIGRLDYYQRVQGPQPAIELRGERYPLAHLASYLKLQPGPVEDRSSVLLVNAGKRRVALLVDAIVAQQEVVSKPLGPHLRDVRGVAGAAVLGNGQVVLILELLELLQQQPRGSIVLPEPGSH
ncbi:MAG: Hpt domain-containing protein, partial [Ktedonobacterales bacterium]